MSKEQTLLVIGKVWPEPQSSAAGWRILQILQFFREQHWQITFASAASKSEYSADLASLGILSAAIQLNDVSFDQFVKELNPTAVLFDRFTSEEQFGWRVAEHCPNALRLLDTEDLHGLRAARELALKHNRKFETADLFSTVMQREVASIYRCDLSLIISEFEFNLLCNELQVPETLLFYLPLLSTGPLPQFDNSFDSRHGFVSIGNFLHGPNRDAVHYLKSTIWPLIRARLPKAELRVYGAYPDTASQNFHNKKEGFLVMGRAESAEEVMSAARICLAPLRYGAGQKGKLVLAMACGTPSLTTHVGAEAMYDTPSWPGFLSDDPLQFAEAAVKLYSDVSAWSQARDTAKHLLNSFYSPQKHWQRFQEKMTALLANLTAHRLTNFTGFMLQQNERQSTRYMALWIESKNKTTTAPPAQQLPESS